MGLVVHGSRDGHVRLEICVFRDLTYTKLLQPTTLPLAYSLQLYPNNTKPTPPLTNLASLGSPTNYRYQTSD